MLYKASKSSWPIILRKRKKRVTSTAHVKRAPVPDAAYMLADPCAYCGGKANQWEHIEPVYYGGTHTADNLARACWPCNSRKATRTLLRFLAYNAHRRALTQ